MITIYGKEDCKHCQAAVLLCEQECKPYVYVPVDDPDSQYGITGTQLVDICPVPVSTVPQVFDDGVYVGGFEAFNERCG